MSEHISVNPVNRALTQSHLKTTKVPAKTQGEPPKQADADHMSLGATTAPTYTPESVRMPVINIPKDIKPGEITTTQLHGILERNLPPYKDSAMYKNFIDTLYRQDRSGLEKEHNLMDHQAEHNPLEDLD